MHVLLINEKSESKHCLDIQWRRHIASCVEIRCVVIREPISELNLCEEILHACHR